MGELIRGQPTPGAHGNDEVQTHQEHPFQPVAFAVADEVVNQQNRDKHHDHLEYVEAERHVIDVHAPAYDDDERDDEQGDLHAGADSDANGQILGSRQQLFANRVGEGGARFIPFYP